MKIDVPLQSRRCSLWEDTYLQVLRETKKLQLRPPRHRSTTRHMISAELKLLSQEPQVHEEKPHVLAALNGLHTRRSASLLITTVQIQPIFQNHF